MVHEKMCWNLALASRYHPLWQIHHSPDPLSIWGAKEEACFWSVLFATRRVDGTLFLLLLVFRPWTELKEAIASIVRAATMKKRLSTVKTHQPQHQWEVSCLPRLNEICSWPDCNAARQKGHYPVYWSRKHKTCRPPNGDRQMRPWSVRGTVGKGRSDLRRLKTASTPIDTCHRLPARMQPLTRLARSMFGINDHKALDEKTPR